MIRDIITKGLFPHKIYYIPKAGSDALRLAFNMCKNFDPSNLWEVVLYVSKPLIDKFPEELFFDNNLIWHQQQFGKNGHIAFADLVIHEECLFGLDYASDLVQGQSKRIDYKNRINKAFRGWHYLLLNSILNFALETNIKTVFSPTSDLIMQYTDSSRKVQKELFERVYDRAVQKQYQVLKKGGWWVIDVAENRGRIIIPEKNHEVTECDKTICVCHDIERGYGHLDVNPTFSDIANKTSQKNIEDMLKIEEEMKIKTTYNVLGSLFNQLKGRIEKDGHCVAFHSYDHNRTFNQLRKCRKVDYRVKGYRPARSRLTYELNDRNLRYHNFEWLASGARSLKIKVPRMENVIVKIPIFFDDFDLYQKKMNYKDWERMAIDRIKQNDFIAFCLHDCYADYWLPYYKEFLRKLTDLGTLKTLNEISSEISLMSSR